MVTNQKGEFFMDNVNLDNIDTVTEVVEEMSNIDVPGVTTFDLPVETKSNSFGKNVAIAGGSAAATAVLIFGGKWAVGKARKWWNKRKEAKAESKAAEGSADANKTEATSEDNSNK